MSYLSYQEYVQFGGNLKELDFKRINSKAESIIDVRTFNSLKFFKLIPKEVKLLTFELIDYLYNQSILDYNLTSKRIKTGSVSQEETYKQKSFSEIQNHMYDIIYSYLYNVCDDKGNFVLFAGVE